MKADIALSDSDLSQLSRGGFVKDNNDKIKRVVWAAVAFSFIAHISLMPSKFDFLSGIDLSALKEKKEKRIKLRFAKPEQKKKLNQIVATEKRNLDIQKESSYLSEFNNSTERETKAKRIGSFNKAGKGNAEIDTKAQKAQKKKITKTKNKVKKKKKGSKISFADFKFTEQTKELKQQVAQVKGQKNGDANSRGLAQSNDYLEEVPLGDMTQLNTKEFKYYGFYFRIKQKLEQYWGKSLKEKLSNIHRRKGRFPASEKHITALKVIMDSKGNIVRVHLKSSSGVQELDEAAIESFNNAGPFPNPPKGMIKNGRASVEWGFAVTNS